MRMFKVFYCNQSKKKISFSMFDRSPINPFVEVVSFDISALSQFLRKLKMFQKPP